MEVVMQKVLDLSKVMTEFDGKPITEQRMEGEGKDRKVVEKDILLKDGLLGYIRRADRMGLKKEEQDIAFQLGFILAKAEGKHTFTTAQYDLIKKISDLGEMKDQSGENSPIYGFVLRNQIKVAVDEAENAEDTNK